jgi:outer membrane receptor protein involved in Fe transport
VRRIALVVVCLLSSLPACAQNASISGLLKDPSGAVVPNATVKILGADTGVLRTTTSNGSGYYSASELQPGRYMLTVRAAGFETVSKTNIILQVAQSIEADFVLPVGKAQDVVTVRGNEVQLDTASASLATTIESQSFRELPLLGRNPYTLVELSPGVSVHGNPGTGPSINGGRSNTNGVLLDGADVLNSTTNDISYTVPLEAVEEVKVQLSSYSSEYGRAGGGVLNGISRSGKNQFHGALYEFIRNDAFNANSYTNNFNGLPRAAFKRNEFGVAVGGPVILPHVYNGTNHTFFFFNYEGIRQHTPQTIIDTVPTELQREGDFSQTYTTPGKLVTIYDPATSTPDPSKAGSYVRYPFSNNRIPISRIDPTALNIVKFFPLPNLPGNNGLLNHEVTGTDVNNINRVFIRGDQNIGEKQHIFIRYGWQGGDDRSTIAGNIAYPRQTSTTYEPVLTTSYTGMIVDDIVFTPSLLLDIRASFTRGNSDSYPSSRGFDLGSLGFAPSFSGAVTTPLFPRITTADAASLGPDTTSDRHSHQEDRQVFGSVTWVKGRHIFKMGGDLEAFHNNTTAPFTPAGDFSFTRGYTQGPNPAQASANAGWGVASLLLGVPASGSVTIDPSLAMQQFYIAGFAQDTIRLTSTLTAEVGVRYEHSNPWTERHNQLSYFDQNAIDPVTGMEGLLTPVDNSRRGQTISENLNFSPRIGLAWSLQPGTVFRAGYGTFYSPGNGGVGAVPSEFGSGYQSTTSLFMGQPDTDPYKPPVGATLATPFITGLNQPPSSLIGTNISSFFNVTYRVPRNDQWTASVQQAGKDFVAELGYTGSRGEHLWIDRQRDLPGSSVLSQGNSLLQQVPNPFYGEITTGTLSSKTVQRVQLLRPYSQYTGVSQKRDPAGDSIYHALTARLDKRFSRGYSILASYTWSKLIDDVPERFGGRSYVSDPTNLSTSRALGDFDSAHVFSLAHVVDLPFGPKQHFLQHGPAAWVLGGWQLNGVIHVQSGFPISITSPNVSNISGFSSHAEKLHTGRLLKTSPTRDAWFDTSAFQIPAPFTLGNDSRNEPDIRTRESFDYDLGLDRSQAIGENVKVQLRAEAFNLTNTPLLDDPNSTVGDPNFGRILGGSNPRVLQLGLRISY